MKPSEWLPFQRPRMPAAAPTALALVPWKPSTRLFLLTSLLGWSAFYLLRLGLMLTRCARSPGISICAATILETADHAACAASSIIVWRWIVARRLPEKGWGRTALEGSVICTVLNLVITLACIAPFRAIYEPFIGPSAVYEATVLHLMSAPLWFALVLAFVYFDHGRGVEQQRAQVASAMQEAQLAALRGQVNPHFLFNSFNVLRALIRTAPDKAGAAVDQIADILRYSLRTPCPELLPLKEELAVVDQYLELEQMRFGARLRIEREVQPGLGLFPVPPLVVQGLVENAVKHGPTAAKAGGLVRYQVAPQGDGIIITVANTGKLARESSSTGIGVANIRERLQLIYGGTATFELREEPGPCVVATLVLPHPPRKAALSQHENSDRRR